MLKSEEGHFPRVFVRMDLSASAILWFLQLMLVDQDGTALKNVIINEKSFSN
ncbi:MAG: hypothetical protein AVDCRST_MAG96-2557 [uncultured Segetibacter sp.]|uniref:Uncharacterized protein n=1 Tax=uncultured Segetibacter sp. TaxID=481133 RepID=A0A6J4T3V0_9BACT|nr:MAG: hypothetical protein AVDCRST_MAG96-2557 [uncultured Segetibacter sp.]